LTKVRLERWWLPERQIKSTSLPPARGKMSVIGERVVNESASVKAKSYSKSFFRM